jgi:hypothetical protein
VLFGVQSPFCEIGDLTEIGRLDEFFVFKFPALNFT